MGETAPEVIDEHVHVDGDEPCTGCGWHAGPVLLWEGEAAMFARPDGGRVIRYDQDGEEKFISLPPELVPGLQMLLASPGLLDTLGQSPLGGMARRMVGQLTRKAEAQQAAANGG